ncbi:MAG: M50 family metallopeptidase [Caulobacteraceae bacterium]
MRIKLNPFFILFLFTSFMAGWLVQSLALFASVLLHELGHVYIARIMKIEVYEVELLPYGGVARMEEIAKFGGFAEAAVAVAGPVTSGLIALVCYFFSDISALIAFCARCNLIIGIFNLVPVLPLDGGKIARNLLFFFMGYKQATSMLVLAGRFASIALLAYNIYALKSGGKSAALMITAVFIYIGTIKEERFASYYYLLMNNSRKTRMVTRGKIRKRVVKAYEHTKIREVINYFSPVTICTVYVIDLEGNTLRALDETAVINGFLECGYEGIMGQVK